MLPFIGLFACSAPVDDSGVPIDTGATTWSGDVTLDEDYVVEAGETLVIEPGATVTASGTATLTVEGELRAAGTVEDPVTFTGAGWGGIVFEPSAVSASYEGVDVYSAGSIVENVVVQGATRGMHVMGASPYVHAVTFRSNEIPMTVDTVGGAGLLISDGSTSRVRDCLFDANTANTFAFGGGVYVDRADPILQDNAFLDNVGSYGGGIATDLMASPLVGNRFERNYSQSEGGAISLVSSVSALLANAVSSNTSETDGAGVHVCVDCYPHAAPYLYDNVITDNLSANEDPTDGAAGIGAAFFGALSTNDVHGNLRAGEPSDLTWFNLVEEAWPAWVASPSVSDVWWGTADAAAIAASVYDGDDDPTYATLTVDGARSEPIPAPIPRAVIATRKMKYEDAGDDIPVFLTVYNPGPERVVTLSIALDGAAPDLDLGYPGAEVDPAVVGAAGWTLTLPEDSVWFGTIADSTYDGSSTVDVTWSATLTEGGTALGEPVIARYFTAPAP